MSRIKPLLAALSFGMLPTVVLSLDGFWDTQLLFFVGLSCAVGGWFFARDYDPKWKVATRWQVLPTLVIFGSAMFGIHNHLPIQSDLRLALVFLVIGVGLATLGIGVRLGRMYAADPETPAASPTTAD